jgi:hypothetical protein
MSFQAVFSARFLKSAGGRQPLLSSLADASMLFRIAGKTALHGAGDSASLPMKGSFVPDTSVMGYGARAGYCNDLLLINSACSGARLTPIPHPQQEPEQGVLHVDADCSSGQARFHLISHCS